MTDFIFGLTAKLKTRTKLLIVIVSITVFTLISLSAAVFMFIRSGNIASEAIIMDRMSLEVSTVAEALKASNGNMQTASQLLTSHRTFDISDDSLVLYYDDTFSPSAKNSSQYHTTIQCEKHIGYYSYDISIFKDRTETKDSIFDMSFKAIDTGGAVNE